MRPEVYSVFWHRLCVLPRALSGLGPAGAQHRQFLKAGAETGPYPALHLCPHPQGEKKISILQQYHSSKPLM